MKKKKCTVTKKEIVKYIQEHTGFSARSLSRVLDKILEEIKLTLEKGEEVKIVRFGTFSPYKRPSREGINPQNGKRIFIKGQKTVIFKPSPTLKHLINRH